VDRGTEDCGLSSVWGLEPGPYRWLQEGSEAGVLQEGPGGRVNDGVELRGGVEDGGLLAKKMAESGFNQRVPAVHGTQQLLETELPISTGWDFLKEDQIKGSTPGSVNEALCG